MIVPMKKATVIVQAKDSSLAIGALRALGVMHLEHQRTPAPKELGMLQDELALIDTALGALSADDLEQQDSSVAKEEPDDWRYLARHVLDIRNRISQLKEYAFSLSNSISQWLTWGDFNPETIRALKEKGVEIRLYQIPVKEIAALSTDLIVKKISVYAGIANCMLISRRPIELAYKEVTLPKMGLAAMQERLAVNNKTVDLLKQEMGKLTSRRLSLLRIKNMFEEELEFHQALKGMGQAQAFAYVRGYVPNDAERAVRDEAQRQQWGLVISDPSGEDNVPTLVRNPRWIAVISPLFRFIEIVPGYRELDISLCFLIFFSIFFGMIVGDAGIGLIFLGLIYFAQRKLGKKLKDHSLFILLYICSGCAVIWGLLSGTCFGQEWLTKFYPPPIPALRNDKAVQAFCFFLGALHLSIAHVWRAMLKLPALSALADIGWILILWGGFFLARLLVLAETFPAFANWLFISGIILVLFFTNPQKNVLKAIGSGLGTLLLNLVNSFTDVVSYIRLFAVGLATVAMADAFNRMALEMGGNSLLGGLVTAIILFTGHALNVVLSPMSVLVHGVRLNVLEFCSHADVKWSGFVYNPLRKKINSI
ncbi:MAG: hypothetical protein V1727_03430 [Candidatus Omnitrophota bacterium]